MKIKLLIFCALSIALPALDCFARDNFNTEPTIDTGVEEITTHKHYLPDGTEIRFIKNKAYYYCRGKFLLLPDGDYLLADGSVFTMKDGVLTHVFLTDKLQQ